MSQIATVELIYVAHSGRQYRAQHKQVHTGWELDDLKSRAKSDLSLRDYAIEFTNVNGHTQFIMPSDLETIIVNVVAITEERWEEPDYEALQQKWTQAVKPYGESPAEATQETPAPPNPERAKATGQGLQAAKVARVVNPVAPVAPDGETTQSIKITWPTAPRPEQRVNWPVEKSEEKTQPISTIPGELVGMSEEDATAVIERIAAGGTITSDKD